MHTPRNDCSNIVCVYVTWVDDGDSDGDDDDGDGDDDGDCDDDSGDDDGGGGGGCSGQSNRHIGHRVYVTNKM